MKQESRIARPCGGENYAIYIPSHIFMHSICMFSHKTALYEVYHSICIRGYQHILMLLQSIYFPYRQKYPKDFEHENKRKHPWVLYEDNRLGMMSDEQKYMGGNRKSGLFWEDRDSQRSFIVRWHKSGNVKGAGGTNTNSNFHCMRNTVITITD